MKTNKGFTLIELAVVLAIIAVLAAVLTPVVTGYLEQARLARAAADVRTIADAVKLYKDDTGSYPFYDSSANATTNTTASTASAHDVIASSTGSWVASGGWTTGAIVGTTSLEAYLNTNVLSRSTSAGGGRARFNGPYVGNVDADPWNNRYYINVGELAGDATSWAFVVSAGPNGDITTSKAQAKTGAFTVGGDDIAAVIH